jgi:hypothetical protein
MSLWIAYRRVLRAYHGRSALAVVIEGIEVEHREFGVVPLPHRPLGNPHRHLIWLDLV